MYIDNLQLIERKENKVIRQVKFKEGVNFIVDAESSENHNKVGKTTFLRLIDILLGAKDKKLLYRDSELNASNTHLRDLIVRNRIAVKGTFVPTSPQSANKTLDLEVELFPNGKNFINGEKFSAKDYREQLYSLFFQPKCSKLQESQAGTSPSFRELMSSFIRISKSVDSHSFLKVLYSGSNLDYHRYYSYLLSTPLEAEYNRYHNVFAELSKEKAYIKDLKASTQFQSEEERENELSSLEGKSDQLKLSITNFSDRKEFTAWTEAGRSLTKDLEVHEREEDELNYEVSKLEFILSQLNTTRDMYDDIDVFRKFYDEIESLMPSLNVTFKQMLQFNRVLIESREKYLIDLLKTKRESLLEARTKRGEAEQKLNSHFTPDFAAELKSFQEGITELNELQQKIGRLSAFHNEVAERQKAVEEYESQLDNLNTSLVDAQRGSSLQNHLAPLNESFRSFASDINGQSPRIIYNPDPSKFPLEIENLDSTSAGTKKSLLTAFDLALQEFLCLNFYEYPQFILHDFVENIEAKALSMMFSLAERSNCQYIVAVLQEKLESSGVSTLDQDSSTILRLSASDRLFEPANDN